MKKSGFLVLASLILVSGVFAQRTVVVTNKTAHDRKAEIVEISLSTLKLSVDKKLYILKNSKQEEVAYQLVKNGNKKVQSVIFQVDVRAKSSSSYTFVKGKPADVKPKTFARFVPERKDDFAWENDMAAYRMYGPALANENPSNGVDFWAKATENLVVDQRYKDDIYNGISYHIDHGFGLDFYKVAHTLGCGGIAPFAGGKLWVGNYFNNYKVIEVGPLRSVFTLTYDSVQIAKSYYKEELTITADAGSLLNKAEVKYTGAGSALELAAGIYLHDGAGALNQDIAAGTLAYAENAVSDAGVPAGRNYIGVFIPGKVNESTKDVEHALLLSNYKTGGSFTYYFGGGWSKWHYPTDSDWFKAVTTFAENAKSPLQVTIK